MTGRRSLTPYEPRPQAARPRPTGDRLRRIDCTTLRRSVEGNVSPDRRRRAVLAGVGSALTGVLAGCSSDGDGATPTQETGGSTGTDAPGGVPATSDPGPSDAGGTESPTPTPEGDPVPTTEDPAGTVVEDTIPEIEILGYTTQSSGRSFFDTYVNVQNGGGEALDIQNYTWRVVAYDESGSQIDVSAAGPVRAEFEGTLEPGDSGVVSYHLRLAEDAPAVDSYEIYLTCDGAGADGTYCPE